MRRVIVLRSPGTDVASLVAMEDITTSFIPRSRGLQALSGDSTQRLESILPPGGRQKLMAGQRNINQGIPD